MYFEWGHYCPIYMVDFEFAVTSLTFTSWVCSIPCTILTADSKWCSFEYISIRTWISDIASWLVSSPDDISPSRNIFRTFTDNCGINKKGSETSYDKLLQYQKPRYNRLFCGSRYSRLLCMWNITHSVWTVETYIITHHPLPQVSLMESVITSSPWNAAFYLFHKVLSRPVVRWRYYNLWYSTI